MCAAFEEVRNEGYDISLQEGAEQKELSNVKILMDTMNFDSK
jgi:hypothetical protein